MIRSVSCVVLLLLVGACPARSSPGDAMRDQPAGPGSVSNHVHADTSGAAITAVTVDGVPTREQPSSIAGNRARAAVALDAFRKELGEERLQKLKTRLESLNRDIATRGMLRVPGEPERLLTGYAYGQFYDWDLYFENLYLSYFGVSDYCFSNFRAFLRRQQPDGFVARSFGPKPFGTTQHFKPFLAQLAVLGTEQTGGSYEWMRATYFDDLKRYLNRWFAYDHDGNGLPVWDSSDASGMDNETSRAGRRGSFFCEGTDLACELYRELQAMGYIAKKLGRAADQAVFQARAAALATAVNTVLWDERDGFYYDRNEKTGERIRIKSVAGFLPLWAGIAPPDRAARLVREHLTNPKEFWLKYPVASYAATEPDFFEGTRGGCNWRGPNWVPTDYMIMHGLIRYGYRDIAHDLALRCLAMALDENPVTREYYDSDSGKGSGMNPFWGWSSLAYVMPLDVALGYDPMALPAATQPWLVRDLGVAAPRPAAAAIPVARVPDKLNVVLIISDDLRDTVGCYGNRAVKTPNIDALAARGVRFDHAYAQYPMCNPSRVSFLTGLRCEQTDVVTNRVMFRTRLPEVVTLPQMLRAHGWYAASYGKVFHADVAGEIHPDWMDVGRSWDEGLMFRPTAAGSVRAGRNLTGGKLNWCEWGATGGTDDDQPDGQTAQHAIATIEKLEAAGRPWMVAAGFHRPHDPFISPQKYFDLYPAGSLTVYHDPADMTPGRPMTMPGGAFMKAFSAFTDQDRLEFLRAYYAGVSFMDAQVGRLIAALDRARAWDHTLVIFCGDNGYHHNERGWWNKNTLFERSCRVPLIIVAPGAKAGTVCRSLVELVDLYPTVADYCGVAPGQAPAGTSLRPLLENPERPGRDAAYTLVVRGGNRYGQSVRTARWRYTRWSDGTAELYDEASDPEETHDVSDLSANRAVVASLQQLLARIGAPHLPAKN